MGAYDFDTGRLLGTSCSAPIAMCSNNDVPKKAPYIPIEIPVAAGWPQWRLCPQVLCLSFTPLLVTMTDWCCTDAYPHPLAALP